jgi:hypothetical protein
MDNRRAPGSTGPTRYVSHVGADTVAVNPVELAPVGGSKPSRPPLALVAVVGVALIAFALGASTAAPATPTRSAGPVAIATGTAATRDFSTLPTASALISREPATPEPTYPPAWGWTRTPILGGDNIELDGSGAWGLHRDILLQVRRLFANGNFGGWSFARLEPGRDWALADPPRAIRGFYGGTVLDDALSFVGAVDGASTDDVSWQVVSTRDGVAWTSLGPSIGLGIMDGDPFLGRVGGNWVAAPWHYIAASDEGAVQQNLRFSADGRVWDDATVLRTLPGLAYEHAASNGHVMVILAHAANSASVVLYSGDGMTWRQAGVDPDLDASTIACDPAVCIISGYEKDAIDPPVAWVSADGATWTPARTVARLNAVYSVITAVTTVPGGFLALSGTGPWAWLSSADAMDWQPVRALPEDLVDELGGVAAADDLVAAPIIQNGDEQPAVWRGTLFGMSRGLP